MFHATSVQDFLFDVLCRVKSRREIDNDYTFEEKQQLIHCEVQAQKEAVTAAQWKFFETALVQDQALMSKVKRVPLTIKSKLHAKLVEQRQSQADAGQKAATGYQALGLSKHVCIPNGVGRKHVEIISCSFMDVSFQLILLFCGFHLSQDAFLRVTSVAKPDLVMAEVAKMKTQVAAWQVIQS